MLGAAPHTDMRHSCLKSCIVLDFRSATQLAKEHQNGMILLSLSSKINRVRSRFIGQNV